MRLSPGKTHFPGQKATTHYVMKVEQRVGGHFVRSISQLGFKFPGLLRNCIERTKPRKSYKTFFSHFFYFKERAAIQRKCMNIT